LDSYLANGLGIELHLTKVERSTNGAPFDFPIGSLPLIDEREFVLTLDFVMKMLCMNERIECRVPCIMEGETGVSKTALTRMLFMLKNTEARSPSDIELAVLSTGADSHSCGVAERKLSALRKLADLWGVGDQLQGDANVWRNFDGLARSIVCFGVGSEEPMHVRVAQALLAELRADPSLDPLAELSEATVSNCIGGQSNAQDSALQLLRWYVTTCVSSSVRSLDWTFFPIDVHAALTPQDIANEEHSFSGIKLVVARAVRLNRLAQLLDSDRHRRVTLCLFFDEFNTSSCMGFFKELLIDHSFDGEPLPENIVVVAAGNPSRDKIETSMDTHDEQGHQWAIGHYQVHPLPASMQQLMWDYGSLKPDQEREFIQKRLRFLQSKEGLSDSEMDTLVRLVHASQQETRSLARQHIEFSIKKSRGIAVSAKELDARASSSVSLRDILRVFKLFSFFNQSSGPIADVFLPDLKSPQQRRHRSMLLSLAVVYYLRLGSDGDDLDQAFRMKFRTRLKKECGRQDADVEGPLARAMSELMDQTVLEPGIAQTRGLRENIFMVVICCLAQVPLMIVGPPGSSKTLAVTVVAENARGEYSKTDFYKASPAFIRFHYQCSRRSTSREIQAVFERAIERQAKADREKMNLRCFVFMDEAGLPEEERESLKVLHYYLEDHMSVAAKVGFVAITNHLLDTAKVNRCALLTRIKPDHEELMNIARGCLGNEKDRHQLVSTVPAFDSSGDQIILELDPTPGLGRTGLLDALCKTYDACMSDEPAVSNTVLPPADFVSLFGLRDFMHFIKLLGRLALQDLTNPTISREKIVEALERNMNGVEPARLRELLDYFLAPFSLPAFPATVQRTLRNPLDLMRASLSEQSDQAAPISRYKLVIDTTTDDSILRALQSILSATTVKLSHFPEDSAIQQINAISQVKWAAEKGEVVLISQTESINESFYDLFNQHFRKFEDKSEYGGTTVTYHANIAVGSHSRRCKVEQGFQCVVHLAVAELQLAPAPFLNRFEKYRLTHADLLESYLWRTDMHREVPLLGDLLRTPALVAHVQNFVNRLGAKSFYGFAVCQTIESALFCLLSGWQTATDVIKAIMVKADDETFRLSVEAELDENEAASAAVRDAWDNRQFIEALVLRPTETQKTAGLALLGQCILHALIAQLVQVIVPEHLFKHPASLPTGLLQSYLINQQEHFSLAALLRRINSDIAKRHIVYTRTCAAVLALQSSDAIAEEKLRELVRDEEGAVPAASIACVNFSLFTREPQLVRVLEDFFQPQDPRKVLILLVDGAQTLMSQVNFARHKIDEIQPVKSEKSIVLVIHVPATDLHIHACYDTTFCLAWTTTFLDSVENEGAVSWLELSAGLGTAWDMMPALESWLPSALGSIARFIELPLRTLDLSSVVKHAAAGGVLEKRAAFFGMLLHVDLNGTSFKVTMLTRYCELWAGEDGTFTLLRELLKKKIAALAAGELQVSLVEALTGEVRAMFTKYAMSLICTVSAEMNGHVLLDNPPCLQQVILDFIQAWKIPPMTELTAPIKPVKLGVTWEPPVLSRMFPFFSQMMKIFDVATTQALLEESEDDEDDFAWHRRMAERVEARICDANDNLKAVAKSHLFGEPEAELWQRYLHHFVAHLYPLEAMETTQPIQHQILRAWLTAHIAHSDRKVASLHVAAQTFSTLLKALTSSIEPLATLTPASETRERIVAVINGAEDVETDLNIAIVDAFYTLMQQQAAAGGAGTTAKGLGVGKKNLDNKASAIKLAGGQPPGELIVLQSKPPKTEKNSKSCAEAAITGHGLPALCKWAHAFSKAKLQDVLSSNVRGVDMKKVGVMRVVEAAVHSSQDLEAITGLIRGLDSLVHEGNLPRLSLTDVWQVLEQHGSLSSNAALSRRLIEGWSCSRAPPDADLECIITTILTSASLTTPQRAPLLETVLLFRDESQEMQCTLKAIDKNTVIPGSLLSWLEALQVSRRAGSIADCIERQLQMEAQSICKGGPYWFETPLCTSTLSSDDDEWESAEEDAASPALKAKKVKQPKLCRDGDTCTRKDCRFAHPGRDAVVVKAAMPALKVKKVKPPKPCRDGNACTRDGCRFAHLGRGDAAMAVEAVEGAMPAPKAKKAKQPKPCCDGDACIREDCRFTHPGGGTAMTVEAGLVGAVAPAPAPKARNLGKKPKPKATQQPEQESHLTRAFFHMVWKWLLFRHAKDELSELAGLAQRLQTARTLDQVPLQRSIALSAVRVLIVDHVAMRVASAPMSSGSVLHDGDEADRVMGQLEAMTESSSAPCWACELALVVCTKVNGIKKGQHRLDSHATAEEQTNRLVAGWIKDAAATVGPFSTADCTAFQTRRPPLPVPSRGPELSILDLLAQDLQKRGMHQRGRSNDPFVRQLVLRRRVLRLFWVIPDLLEFYNWITNTLNGHPIGDEEAKQLTLASLLERVQQTEDGEYYRLLWVRVKVGVNMYIKEQRATLTPLDECLAVWSILSTNAVRTSTDHLPMDCLHSALSHMLMAYDEFRQQAQLTSLKAFNQADPRFLDALSEINAPAMQDTLGLQSGGHGADLKECEITLAQEIRVRCDHLDAVGYLARSVENNCTWESRPCPNRWVFDLSTIGSELEAVACGLRRFPIPQRYRRICRFESSVSQPVGRQSYHFQVYHSLTYDNLRALISALQPIKEYVETAGQDGTVLDKLAEMYPGATDDNYLSRAYIDLEEEEQRAVLLGTPASELPQLCDFLRDQLECEAYSFAHESLELKGSWGAEVDAELIKLQAAHKDLAAEARLLEAGLIKYKLRIAAAPEQPIHVSLARAFTSEAALLKEIPMLCELKQIAANIPAFQFNGSHYVKLRRMLRAWVATPEASAPVQPWVWPFLSSNSSAEVSLPVDNDVLRAHMTPWFLIDPPEVEAARREKEDKERMEVLRQAEEGVRQQAAIEAEVSRQSQFEAAGAAAKLNSRGRGRGRGGRAGNRGRRSGLRSSASLGQLVQADARNIQVTLDVQQTAKERLVELYATAGPIPASLVADLNVALQHAKDAGINSDDLVLQNALQKREEVEKCRQDIEAKLMRACMARPLNDVELGSLLKAAHNAGVSQDRAEVESATRLLREITSAQATLHSCLNRPFPDATALRKALQAAMDMHLTIPALTAVKQKLSEMEGEAASFAGAAKHRWGASGGNRLVALSARWQGTPESSSGLPSNPVQRKAAEKALADLAKSGDRKSVDTAIEALELLEGTWPHAKAYLGAANGCSTHIDVYRTDAEDYIEEYMEDVGEDAELVPALLLAAARLCEPEKAEFRASCLRRCYVHETQGLMTEDEQHTAQLPAGTAIKQPCKQPNHSSTGAPESRWAELKMEKDAISCPALDELMEMIGLKTVKEQALEVYVRVLREKALPADRRVPQTLNFVLLGNPGTGKTTVAKILGRLLKELGVRSSATFIETTGEKLARMGADKFAQLVDDAMGGVLFIDEAYALEPERNAEGRAVAMQLLDVAEARRTELTIILAGYKEDIEQKLFDFNDGFGRRFSNQVSFEDYTEPELAAIFQQMCDNRKWPPSGPDVVSVAARRVARGRGRKAFGNAGAVRVLFEAAYRRALDRDATATTLTVVDVIGPRPDRSNVPALGAAIDELAEMIGIEMVKESVQRLVDLAATNYDRELRGEAPYSVPLNRLFLGNPGTGKTTVAKLYGRVLKAAGLLSDGKSELKQPSDFIGSFVGETPKRTSALVKRCTGKVLIIDEAYGLNNSSYGHEAIDTMVGLVHGAPGEDIAVIMIGYEKQMKKMFREANSGLTRRFGMDDAFRFEDFSDKELDRIVLTEASAAGLKVGKSVRKHVIKALGAQRSRPNFGNAGAAVTMVARAKERLASRSPMTKDLTLVDFALDKADGDGSSALAGLYKIDHIQSTLDVLKATLQQCDRDGKDRSLFLENYLFLGNPGTGKTTIARAMAQILHEIGVLGTNNIVTCSGLDLQGSYVGQTKDKVNEIMAEAQGGALFIDEAYTLGTGTQFAKEALDQLVGLMTEPEHKNKTVLILAGYKGPMEQACTANAGAFSRFTGRIEFPDWDAADCTASIRQRCDSENIHLPDSAAQELLSQLREIQVRPGWANARDSETTYRQMYAARAVRCASAAEAEPTFVLEDVVAAMEKLRAQRPLGDPIAQVNLNAQMNFDGFVGGQPGLPHAPVPQVHRESEVQIEDITEEDDGVGLVDAEERAPSDGGDGMDPVYVALLRACVAEGYDETHEQRQGLIAILTPIHEVGANFPASIMDRVVEDTKLAPARVHAMLKPQVHRVLEAMCGAVQAEEDRREELQRLEAEAARKKEEEHQRLQEKLRACGACPMGYSWYRCGAGWRCTGGSHYKSDADLGI
jgi:MoxR-like ATPase